LTTILALQELALSGLEVLIIDDGRSNEYEQVGFKSRFVIVPEGKAHKREISQNGNFCLYF
jgi:hypothetical protein